MDVVDIACYGTVFVFVSFVIYSYIWIILSLLVAFIGLFLFRRIHVKKIDVEGKAILITGCDTGFGNALAKRLDGLGFTVFACCLGNGKELESESHSGNMHVLRMDITKEEEIARAVQSVSYVLKEKSIGLWGAVNNAGIYHRDEVEFVTIDIYRKLIDVNLLGMLRVTKAFLPFIRESKGRIVNVTSSLGMLTYPAHTVYSGTKAAATVFTEALRMEMFKFGVKVCNIQPSNFSAATRGVFDNVERLKAEFDQSWNEATEEVKNTYGKDYHDAILNDVLERPQNLCKTMEPVINAMEDALMNESPQKLYFVPAIDVRGGVFCDRGYIMALIRWYLPETFADTIMHQVVLKHQHKK